MQSVDLHQAVYDAAYQGAPGAYSEEAAHALLGPTASMLPRRSLEHVFEAVSAGGARHGVVPVENTLSGTVPNVYELLLSHDLRVIGETLIHIDHVLVGPKGMSRDTSGGCFRIRSRSPSATNSSARTGTSRRCRCSTPRAPSKS